jgi:hypothetical protein
LERKVRDSCGKSASRGDPAGESRGGSPTARGKRVPGVEINVQIVQAIKIDKLDFHRVCPQSEGIGLYEDPFLLLIQLKTLKSKLNKSLWLIRHDNMAPF